MTASIASLGKSPARHGSPRRSLRAATWALHIAVTVLAVFSLFCKGFDCWLDLRLLGGALTALVKIFWVGTVLVLPWCAGPRLARFKKPLWINIGWSPDWTRRLLWPTYVVLACLIANTAWFYQLLAHAQIDSYPVPITLLIAILLAAWILLTREWLRQSPSLPASTSTPRSTQIRAALYAALIALAATFFFLLYSYARPVTAPVDVAVVLGNRVLPDGTASVTLRDRTLAAVRLYHAGLVRHLFLSGASWPQTTGPELSEPEAMRQVCLQNGLPEEALTLDPVGDNTRATAFDAARFMKDRNYSSVVVCSDQYHLYRIVKCFREMNLEPRTARALPTQWRCADLFSTARELLGNVVYLLNPNYHKARILTMSLKSPHVLVRKAAGILEIYDGPTLLKKFACITGGNPGDKSVEGDRRTPIGAFHVVFKNPDSQFHLSLGLDYPSAEDAHRGLQSGLITQQQHDDILAALHSDLTLKENQQKLWYTPLGGEIFIHGNAEGRYATAGCVSVSNPDIEEIYAALPLNTPVEIRP